MGMPKGLAKATNYYNNIEARRDFYRLAHEVVSAGHSEIVRKHIPPENAGWRKIDKHIAALRAEWQAFQQSVQRIGLYCAACGSELGENDTCPRLCSQDTPNR